MAESTSEMMSRLRISSQNGRILPRIVSSSSYRSSDEEETYYGETPPSSEIPYDRIRKYLQKTLNEITQDVCDWFAADVKTYKDVPEKKVMTYRVVRIVNPMEFYLQYALDDDIYSYRHCFEEMQEFYGNPYNRKDNLLVMNTAVEGRCYACQDVTDDMWYRVRVHDVHVAKNMATVFFCDLGKLDVVSFDRLLELDPHFAKVSAQVFCCYLYDILGKGLSLSWSDKAIDFFGELVVDKELQGICLARSDSLVTPDLPDFRSHKGMVLFEEPGECTINARMVDENFAEAIGIFAGCKHSLTIPEYTPKFDMQSFREAVGLPQPPPLESPSAKLPTILTENELRVLNSEEAQDLRPPMYWKPIDMFDEFVDDPSKLDATYTNNSERLPAKLIECMCHVKMCFVMGPSTMIVHVQSQIKELDDMQAGLAMMVEKEEALTFAEGRPGDFIACQILDTGEEARSFWCRAIIRSIKPDAFKLILVDYGNEVSVKTDLCRKLPEYFLTIPSFAVRIHLDNDYLIPLGQTGWSNESCLSFRKYVFAWDTADPIYFMFRKPGLVQLSDYNQDLEFDFRARKWVPGPERNIAAHKLINSKREHPLLNSLFRSLAVELFYEVIVEGAPFWYFENLSEYLTANQFARFEKRQKGKDRLHWDILSHQHLTRMGRAFNMPPTSDSASPTKTITPVLKKTNGPSVASGSGGRREITVTERNTQRRSARPSSSFSTDHAHAPRNKRVDNIPNNFMISISASSNSSSSKASSNSSSSKASSYRYSSSSKASSVSANSTNPGDSSETDFF